MIDNAFGAVMAEARDILQRVRRNAVELLDLIIAMLDLSRLEAGRMPVQVREVRLPMLLQELAAETREIWEPAHLELRWQAEENLPPIATDPAKLKIVLKNLIGNAVKFTPQGGITVQARCRGGGIEVCVTDTGIGIPPEAFALIFEPFRQVESDGRGAQRGTGLGLYIVKRLLVDLLNGTVEVESEVGKGSTFRVWLPTGRNPTTS
jgi:signal transduction histidine kinase